MRDYRGQIRDVAVLIIASCLGYTAVVIGGALAAWLGRH